MRSNVGRTTFICAHESCAAPLISSKPLISIKFANNSCHSPQVHKCYKTSKGCVPVRLSATVRQRFLRYTLLLQATFLAAPRLSVMTSAAS